MTQKQTNPAPFARYKVALLETRPGKFYAGHGVETDDRREAMRFHNAEEALNKHAECVNFGMPLYPHSIQELIINEANEGDAARNGWRDLDFFIYDGEE